MESLKQVSEVSEAWPVWQQEGRLWAGPDQSQPTGGLRSVRALPAELLERVLNDLLPQMQQRWLWWERPLPTDHSL